MCDEEICKINVYDVHCTSQITNKPLEDAVFCTKANVFVFSETKKAKITTIMMFQHWAIALRKFSMSEALPVIRPLHFGHCGWFKPNLI